MVYGDKAYGSDTTRSVFSLRLLFHQLLDISLHNLISLYFLLVGIATIRMVRSSRADYDGSSRRSEGHPRGFYEPSTGTSSIGYRKGIGCKTYSSFGLTLREGIKQLC